MKDDFGYAKGRTREVMREEAIASSEGNCVRENGSRDSVTGAETRTRHGRLRLFGMQANLRVR